MKLLERAAGLNYLGSRALEDLVRGVPSNASYEYIEKRQRERASASPSAFVEYENRISDQLNREVHIEYNPENKYGRLTLAFYQISQLEADLKALGYVHEED
jgi:hypothetical protein